MEVMYSFRSILHVVETFPSKEKCAAMKNNVNRYIQGMVTRVENTCSVAQRKRVGLITQRSEDRNLAEQQYSLVVK